MDRSMMAAKAAGKATTAAGAEPPKGGGHGHAVGGRRPAIAGRRRDHHAHGESVDVAYHDRGRGGRSTCQASVVEVSEQAKP